MRTWILYLIKSQIKHVFKRHTTFMRIKNGFTYGEGLLRSFTLPKKIPSKYTIYIHKRPDRKTNKMRWRLRSSVPCSLSYLLIGSFNCALLLSKRFYHAICPRSESSSGKPQFPTRFSCKKGANQAVIQRQHWTKPKKQQNAIELKSYT